jgi:single-stranded-DNA-specific exonuclease
VAAVLYQRGLGDPRAAEAFLDPKLEDLHPPHLLPDYEAAVRVLMAAKASGELIYLHGDYDVDGLSSTAIFARFLSKCGFDVTPHVPHRMTEGYGIHMDAIREAHRLGAKVLLTCDCGSGATEQVEAARELGMKVVVTDHHLIADPPPIAHALVNPHRHDSVYPFDRLSGAGVVFRLCEGIAIELGLPVDKYRRAFLDLAVLGTVADVMPLIGENRIIARHGLSALVESRRPGIRALLAAAHAGSPPPKITAREVGFVYGPRLNAVGRLDDAAKGLRLLLSNDHAESALLAAEIDGLNAERKRIQSSILDEALAQVTRQGLDQNLVIVVIGDGWHHGLVGLVASNLVDRYHRPAFVAARDPETGQAKGSARSIEGFHLADAIRAHPDVFPKGGGHELAAGFSMDVDAYRSQATAFQEYAAQFLRHEELVPKPRIDAVVTADEADEAAAEALSALEPFGPGNETPRFMAQGLEIVSLRPCADARHCQVSLRSESGAVRQGICFGMGEEFVALGQGTRVDVVFEMEWNEWQGRRSLRWIIRDFRPSGADVAP